MQRRGGLPGCFVLPGHAGHRFPEGRLELLLCSSVPSPQLNITTRSAQDGGFLEMRRLRLSSSVTAYQLPGHSSGSSYVVTMQGLTAAGAGAASLWEFQPNSSGKACRVPVSLGRPQRSPTSGCSLTSALGGLPASAEKPGHGGPG